MLPDEPSLTPAGYSRAPTKEILVQWLVNAWDAILYAVIEHSFKKCGILNNLDGTDDDIMFEDVRPVRAATVSDADSVTNRWDDAVDPVPAAFFDGDDESNFEGF